MQHKLLSARFATVLIILASSCWGFTGLFTRPLNDVGLSAIQITFLRTLIAAAVYWTYLLIVDRNRLKIELRDIWMFLGTGIASIAFFSVMYFSTIQTATMSVAAVLLYTSPCFVMLMSAIFFKEKFTKRKGFSLVFALLGSLFTSGVIAALRTGASTISTMSIVTGLLSGFGYALYSIFGNIALKKYNTMTVTAYTFLFASLSLLPFCVQKSTFSAFSNTASLRSIIGVSIVSTVLPYILYTAGLKHTEPGTASVLAFAEPLVATILGLVVFHEAITLGNAIGIAFIFTSIIILNLGNSRKVKT